jgi:hypothetical protein
MLREDVENSYATAMLQAQLWPQPQDAYGIHQYSAFVFCLYLLGLIAPPPLHSTSASKLLPPSQIAPERH